MKAGDKGEARTEKRQLCDYGDVYCTDSLQYYTRAENTK